MTSPRHVIENPLSGELITITERPRVTSGALAWELMLAPGGRVPSRISRRSRYRSIRMTADGTPDEFAAVIHPAECPDAVRGRPSSSMTRVAARRAGKLAGSQVMSRDRVVAAASTDASMKTPATRAAAARNGKGTGPESAWPEPAPAA